jgi:hypothetical protein
MEKDVIYARQRHVWMNVMYDPHQRFLQSVVIYDKHVIYACGHPSRPTRASALVPQG